jgi:pseudouridine kinase
LLSATKTIANPGGGQVVLVGGANMDLTARALRPLTPGDSTPGQIQWAPGGVARNVAENLARLGVASHLVSLVGDDLFGNDLVKATHKVGVNVASVGMRANQRTAIYLSVHGADGDVAMAVNDMAILESLTPDYLQSQQALLQSAACFVLDCNLTPAAMDWIFTQHYSAPVFVDGVSVAKCLRVKPWLSRIHMLKVNALEATELTGQTIQSVADACLAALNLHQSGVRRVVISLGMQGVCWCDEFGGTGNLAARSLPVVNTSGAGDALLAGLIHGHLSQISLRQAVEFAMICAEITLASPFANAPLLSVDAVRSVLSRVSTARNLRN